MQQDIQEAIQENDINKLEELLFQDEDININDYITLAATCDNAKIFDYLHDQGADISVSHEAPFRNACMLGCNKIVKYLLEYDIDVNILNGDALISAIIFGHYDTIKLLLKDGTVNININNGAPLNTAIQYNKIDIIELLLEYKVKLDNINKELLENKDDILKLLQEHGYNNNTNLPEQIDWAMKYGQLKFVKYFADLNIDDDSIYEHFYEFAKKTNNQLILDYLKKLYAE